MEAVLKELGLRQHAVPCTDSVILIDFVARLVIEAQ